VQGGTNALRVGGDKNAITLTDNEAIKNSLLFATKNSDGTQKTLSDLIGATNNLAAKALDSATKQSGTALETLAVTGARSANDIAAAYDKASNNGINIMQLALLAAAVAAVAFLSGAFKG
jgi:ATP phosphoribosyltransferase regulatory subunit HisZ